MVDTVKARCSAGRSWGASPARAGFGLARTRMRDGSSARVPLHVHDVGVDLHAAMHVAPGDRPRLESCPPHREIPRQPLGRRRGVAFLW